MPTRFDVHPGFAGAVPQSAQADRTMRSCVFFLAAALLFGIVPAHAAEPFISEFVPDNARTLVDEDGQFPDWLEIQNPNTTPIDLAGYFLTDNPAQLTKWAFPPVTIPANDALIVFASGKNRTNNPARLHTSFQLNADGGFLALVRPDGSSVVSYFNYPAVDEDVAFGIVQNEITESLLAVSTPRILVPENAAELPPNWNQAAYVPGPGWLTGTAPAGIQTDES